jgi:hypothetical protein
MVRRYFDAETGNIFGEAEIFPRGVIGTSGLGSESGFILKEGIPEYHFGQTIQVNLMTYAYDFTHSYNNGNGDSYTGTVYAAPEHGYYQNYILPVTADENGRPGRYLITGVRTADASGASFDRSLDGQVYVNSYYDQETHQAFTPVSSGAATGANYLGSEHDYIVKPGVAQYLFGESSGTFYEADLIAAMYTYEFIYNNGKGDYYTGEVYASPTYGYYVGLTFSTHKKDENGKHSYYLITGVSYLEDTSKFGQVTVDAYYNRETDRTYAAEVSWGRNYLGSEYGFIEVPGPHGYRKSTPFTDYLFGGGFLEADLKAGGNYRSHH